MYTKAICLTKTDMFLINVEKSTAPSANKNCCSQWILENRNSHELVGRSAGGKLQIVLALHTRRNNGKRGTYSRKRFSQKWRIAWGVGKRFRCFFSGLSRTVAVSQNLNVQRAKSTGSLSRFRSDVIRSLALSLSLARSLSLFTDREPAEPIILEKKLARATPRRNENSRVE